MSKRVLLAIFLAAVPVSMAHAGKIRLLREFPEDNYSNPEWLSAQRFLKIGVDWERDPKGRARFPNYQFFDFAEQRVISVPIPVDHLPSEFVGILGANPSPTVVHFNDDVLSLVFRQSQNYKTIATLFTQYSFRTRQFSPLLPLTAWDDTRYFHDLGFDGTDEHLYYADAVNPAGNALKEGFTRLDLSRINLKTGEKDWSMSLPFPKRKKPLALTQKIFSRDGKKFALVEYADREIQRKDAPLPPPQVLVIDVETKKIDSFPVPLTTYAGFFTRDNKYLVLGSNELGDIVRINLSTRKIDATTKAITHQHKFFPTPSGKSFLVIANTRLASPKVVEVRRVDTLKVQTSIPIRMLYPQNDGVFPDGFSGMDGRFLLLPIVEQASGSATRKGFRLYEVPEEVDSPALEGVSDAELKLAQAAVTGQAYADAHKIQYSVNAPRNPNETFTQFNTAPNGDILLIGTYSDNSDGEWKPGRTRPVVVRVGLNGKKKWERVLTKPGFVDYTGAAVAVTPEGGCIANVMSYVNPGRYPVTRLVKLDAAGKVVWDHQFRGDGTVDSPVGDKYEFRPDGSVAITGRIALADEKKERRWLGIIDADGKVVTDEVVE